MRSSNGVFKRVAAGLLVVVGAPALAGDPPAGDPEQERQQYLEAEQRRADARGSRDYGRHDRADRNRARNAAYDRIDAHSDGRWVVGTYIHAYDRPLHAVRDRRAPRGSRWMSDARGDLVLVVTSSGLISDVVPHD